MIKKQIKDRGVNDIRVLDAMRKVERHRFVPGQEISGSYDDHPLPIGYGQTISQPYIVALMTELCRLNGTEKVLEIGTGSGYQTAVLALLAKKIYSIEIIESLAKSAAKRLNDLKFKNVFIKTGDGYAGWEDEAPFDVIILTACPPEIPEILLNQLSDGGILVSPVGDFNQELVRIERHEETFLKETVTYVRFVPMVHGKDR